METRMIFKNEEFGEIRTVTINDEPWFAGKDVAKALGYGAGKSVNNAVSDHVDEEDKGVTKMETPGGMQNVVIINESGMYSLIMGSKLESAKRFKHWVTSEVLPSIRKNGGYIDEQETMTDDELLSKALMVATNKIAEREKKIANLEKEAIEMNKVIAEMKPKANYVDNILNNKSTVTISQIANDYGMSATSFNKLLKNLHIQHKVGNQWILYSEHQGNGYVHSGTFEFERRNGTKDFNMYTKWTQKGRLFLYEELKKHGILPDIEKELDEVRHNA